MPIDMPPLPVPAGYEQRSSGLVAPRGLLKTPRRGILPGMIPVGMFMPTPGASLITGGFQGQQSSLSNLKTYTFTSCDIGTASSDRTVIVVTGAGVDFQPSSCTINGVSATKIHNISNRSLAIFSAVVPSGTSVSIVVSGYLVNAGYCWIGYYSYYGLTTPTSAYATATDQTAPLDVSLNTTDRCVVVGLVQSDGTITSWSGITQDANVGVSTDDLGSASDIVTAAATPKSVSVATTGTTRDAMAVTVV